MYAATIDQGATAWVLISIALVAFMTPGLAFFYGGMVRKKNVLATVMQSFAITCLVTVLWMIVGYSLAFTEGAGWIGGLSRLFLNGVTGETLKGNLPEVLFFKLVTWALLLVSVKLIWDGLHGMI
mgnify:CR=1 FL=1